MSGAVAGVKGRTGEGWPQDLELVLLPLAQRGDTHARMIGALTPFNAPLLGVSRLGALTLGNVRHLDPAHEMPTAARLVAGTQGPARRAVFTCTRAARLKAAPSTKP